MKRIDSESEGTIWLPWLMPHRAHRAAMNVKCKMGAKYRKEASSTVTLRGPRRGAVEWGNRAGDAHRVTKLSINRYWVNSDQSTSSITCWIQINNTHLSNPVYSATRRWKWLSLPRITICNIDIRIFSLSASGYSTRPASGPLRSEIAASSPTSKPCSRFSPTRRHVSEPRIAL